MRAVKVISVLVLFYVGIVVLLESLLGYQQPMRDTSIVITTTDVDGMGHDRVVAGLETDGRLYVAANHWPRAWYNQALANPQVWVTRDGERLPYLAVPVRGEERDRVNRDHPTGVLFRILTGFPPRTFVRLDPR